MTPVTPETSEASEAPETPAPAAVAAVVETETETETETGPRVRGPRTARLLLAALLLGPVLGAGIGYAVQAGRPPTPLPPLGTGPLAYPQARLDAKDAAALEPKPLNIDGDLRKLLIDRPAGTQDWDNYGEGNAAGWLTAGSKAMSFGDSAREFRSLMAADFRRDAFLAFSRGDTHYRIELMQFADSGINAGVTAWTIKFPEEGGAIPGTANGYYSAPHRQEHYDDSTETFYYGQATARRGTVVMRIYIYSPNPVDANELKDLATRQWERLK
ncbi:hypothetical protein [Kitasatospora sp. NPDC059571]|uniref:hypothetical protein n=1 Tax=Kitasatospora sp. NPDC059571 TaxID=3346871 RepID=UPI0036CD95E4